MTDALEIRSVQSGYNAVIKHGLNGEDHPTDGITKVWGATQAQARKRANEVLSA